MNTPGTAPSNNASLVELHPNEAGIVGKAKGQFEIQGGFAPLWLQARAKTVDFRHADLVQTHWRKVCRSMVED